MARRAARVDSAHTDVVEGLRAFGWSVVDLSAAGAVVPGLPDLLVGIGGGLPFAPSPKARGVLGAGWCCPLEVKSEGGVLTPAQQEWLWQWRGPSVVAQSPEQAAQALDALRRTRGR